MKASARGLHASSSRASASTAPMPHLVPELHLRRVTTRARPTPTAGPLTEQRPQARHRLRRGDEGGARRRGRPGPGLRPGLDGARRHPAGEGGGAAEHDVAGGHDHRRLHPLRAGRPLPRGDAQDLHPHPHRRADLPAAELRRSDREARREHRRPGPGRRRRHRGAQVDRRVRRPPRHPDGAARHLRRSYRAGRSCRSAPPCRATTSPSSTPSPSPHGGTTSSTGCPTRSSRTA